MPPSPTGGRLYRVKGDLFPLSTRKNTLYNVGYRVFSVLLPLVTAPYLSRVCGQVGVGLYSYAWNISYFFCLVAMLGLENYGVRAVARARDDKATLSRVFSSVWRMQRIVAGLTLAVWIAYAALVADEEKAIAWALTPASLSCLVNLDWCLMGLDRFKPIALKNTAVKLAAAACVFIFVKSPDDLWIYGLVWALATLIGCLLTALSLRSLVSLTPVTRAEALRHLKPCAVLFLSVLAVSVYRTMDKVMVGAMAGMAENGLYENAEKIIYCLSGFISAVGTVMMPKVSHMWKQGRVEDIRRHIDLSMQLVLCMVCALGFGIASVAPELAPLYYGEDFRRSGALMIPLAATLILIGFANVVRTQWILPQERDRIVVRSVTAGAAVNLIANSLLIPRMGAMGAVIGTVLAEGTVPVVQYLHLRGELPYGRFLRYALTYCGIGAVMTCAVRLVFRLLPGGWTALAAAMLVGAAVYGVCCLALWRLTKNQGILRLMRRKEGPHPSSR